MDIKPLRSRKEDIPLLTKHFIANSHRRFILKDDAIKKLMEYDWPGNTRELKKKIDLLSTKEKGILHSNDINFSESLPQDNAWLSSSQKEFIQQHGLRTFIKKVEEESVKLIMDKNQGKISKSIKELGISASAFYRIYNETQATH